MFNEGFVLGGFLELGEERSETRLLKTTIPNSWMLGKFARRYKLCSSLSGRCSCPGHLTTGRGRQGPCLSQHVSAQHSPHSLPWQCQESETRAQTVSRPRMSGSWEGLYCAWCAESRLLFCRHGLEPGQKAPRSLVPRAWPCPAASGEGRGLPSCRSLVGHVPRIVSREPIGRGKHLFSEFKTPSNSMSLLFPHLPYLPCGKIASAH